MAKMSYFGHFDPVLTFCGGRLKLPELPRETNADILCIAPSALIPRMWHEFDQHRQLLKKTPPSRYWENGVEWAGAPAHNLNCIKHLF